MELDSIPRPFDDDTDALLEELLWCTRIHNHDRLPPIGYLEGDAGGVVDDAARHDLPTKPQSIVTGLEFGEFGRRVEVDEACIQAHDENRKHNDDDPCRDDELPVALHSTLSIARRAVRMRTIIDTLYTARLPYATR
jgi:hypothetical protein